MPKHRQAGFAVVREINQTPHVGVPPDWRYHGIVGIYQSVQRAEEVASATIQRYLDLGMDPAIPEFRCRVNPTNWYSE